MQDDKLSISLAADMARMARLQNESGACVLNCIYDNKYFDLSLLYKCGTLIVSILLPTFLLISCTTSFSTFEKALPLLEGKHINNSIDYLGIPNGKYQIDDREIYVWSTAEDYVSISPVSSSTHGYVGTTPFNAYSTSYASHISRLSCEIKMSTKQKIVERIEWSGNNGTCFRYSDRLKPLLQAK